MSTSLVQKSDHFYRPLATELTGLAAMAENVRMYRWSRRRAAAPSLAAFLARMTQHDPGQAWASIIIHHPFIVDARRFADQLSTRITSKLCHLHE